ncbi:MAG: response regulator [Chloroflexota bacterium]
MSETGRGSRRTRPAEPRPRDTRPPESALATTPDTRQAPLVLVAEDSRTQAEMIRLTLEAHGYRVVVVGDGVKALARMTNGDIDLVLTDIEMPEMDGFELCRRLKDDPRLRQVPVVVLTQRDRVTDIIRALEVGADNYLTKPFSPAELVTRVGRLLDEVRRWRQRARGQRHHLGRLSDELILSFERTQVVEALMAAAEKIETELGTVGEISLGLTMDRDLDQLLGMIAARTRELSGATMVAIGLCDDATVCELRVTNDGRVAADDSSAAPFPFAGLGLDPAALTSRESVLVSVEEESPPGLDRWSGGRADGATLLVVPLVIDRRLVGLLVSTFAGHRDFPSEELRRYRTLGDQTAVAIQNASALERERRLRERIQQLQRAAGDLGIRHGREAASQRAVDLAREALRAQYAALLVHERRGRLFTTSGYPEATRVGHPPLGRGLLGLKVARGQAVRIPSVAADPRSSGTPAWHPPLADLLVAPIYGADRQLGQLYVANSLDGGFTEDDEQLLPTLAEHVGAMLETGALIDELRRTRAAGARLGRLLDESSDEIHVLDAETLHFVQTNATAQRNLGYSEEELSRLTFADLQSDLTADAIAALLQPLRAGQRDELRIEASQRRKDGSTYPVEVRLQIARSEDRPVFVAIVRDTTERQQLEIQLRQAQKMEAIGHLAGGIAHDFNNLLTAISGYAQLLAHDLDPADERRADVEQILDASDRAARLVRQLLAFSRRQVLRPAIIDLNAIVRGIDALFRPLIGETITFTLALDQQLGSVRADPSQLEQVVMNLVTNARDAMPSGGRLTIETANVELDSTYVASHPDSQPGPHVMLAVSDTGVGMDAATMARLFEPFFTSKEPGKGTGLGLATTYGIVKQSGGNIWVYSEPGRGTTFKVYLPRVEADAGAGETVGRPISEWPVGGTEVVLLVEDDTEVRALAEMILTRHGYTVLSAPNGSAALEVAATTESIALLVTDVMMPGLRGPELAERLVALRPGLRVLYISGYAAEAVFNHDVLAQSANYLEKPFTPDALARKVRAILDDPGAGRSSSS